MGLYEHTIVGKQDLSDKDVDNLINKYSEIINKSGKILKTEKWGIINLARKIKKNKNLQNLAIIKQSRLSVMPIDTKSWKIINKMSKIEIKK